MRFGEYVNTIRPGGSRLETEPMTKAEDFKESGTSINAWESRQAPDPAYQRNLYTAHKLVEGALSGNRWAMLRLQEAMTTSDFAGYFGTVIDRSVLANYQETPYTWSAYAKRASIMDFRQTQIFRFDRGAAVLDGPILPNSYGATGSGSTGIEQISEYPNRKRVSSNYTDQIYKFGARFDISWEAMINDDLDALKDFPALLGQAARRTEEERATKLYTSSTGPNATFFSTANANLLTNSASQFPFIATNNPPLSVTSLAWALQVMAMQLDLDGMPIAINGLVLVVPPALDITARNIVNATQIWMNDQGGTLSNSGSGATASQASAQRLMTANWANGRVTPVVNYFAPIVNTTSGNTAWYLFAAPNNGRPAMQLSFLRGHEMPELFMKSPNALRIGEGQIGPGNTSVQQGGGMASPYDGDFDKDSIAYKERHMIGGTLLDPKVAVASTGVGS